MATGMWTAVSGASAQAQTVDAIANNLANAGTDGFKKDLPTFKEYLSVVERASNKDADPKDIPRGPITDQDLYPLDGKDQSFVVVDGTYTDFSQGPLKVTQNPLDVALDGPGFLEVSTPSGVRYTRQGSLKVAMDGRLVTSDGHAVLASAPGGLAAQQRALDQPGQGGPETQGGVAVDPAQLAARWINVRDREGALSITPQGDVFVGGDRVAKLSVVEFSNAKQLLKAGGSLYENRTAENLPLEPRATVLRQGMIEASNVNPVQEMTAMIRANRNFEQGMKAIKTYNELLGREANDIGKL